MGAYINGRKILGLNIDVDGSNVNDVTVDGVSVVNDDCVAEIDLTGKQDKLTAGSNITIQDNVISATGGSGTVDQRFNPTSTNAQSGVAVHEAVAPATSKANNALDMLGDVPEETDVQSEIDDLDERVSDLEQGGGGGDVTPILKVMKAIIKKAEYTEPVTSLFAKLEELLPDGVVQNGSELTIRSEVTAAQSGTVLTIE